MKNVCEYTQIEISMKRVNVAGEVAMMVKYSIVKKYSIWRAFVKHRRFRINKPRDRFPPSFFFSRYTRGDRE